jgi:hypothetical protein
MEMLQTKESSLQILDKRESKLIELADKYKGLTIAGHDDKEGYKKVREARIELKNERVAVENDAYELRENAIKFQKSVIAREKELVAIISTTEKNLQEEETKYTKALEAIRVEKERNERDRIQNRIKALAKFKYALDLYEVSTMPDDKFNELITQVEIDFNTEQERIAAEKAEEERLRVEEYERLRSERIALEKEKAEQLAREKELRLQEIDRAEKARQENEKIAAERRRFEEEKRQHAEAIRQEQVKKEAAERAKIEEEEKAKREAKELANALERDKREAIRQEALKPDKEKLFQYAKTLMAVPLPELTHKDAVEIGKEIAERVVQAAEFIHDRAQRI